MAGISSLKGVTGAVCGLKPVDLSSDKRMPLRGEL